MIVRISELEPKSTQPLGATLAEQHMASLHADIAKGRLEPGTSVVFDFTGIKSVNGSYIKGTIHWTWVCGQLSAVKSPSNVIPRSQADPRSYEVFVAVAGVNQDVMEELVEFYDARKLPMIVCDRWAEESIEKGRLIGHLDRALLGTYMALQALGDATAPELHAHHPDHKVSVTAWNNRLSDLHALRLVRRERNGRAWRYHPLAKRTIYGS